MPRYTYDLHIHSCLSPCSDNLMTPPNIANMAYVKGLDIIAITDHNSVRNAGAVIRAAKNLPLTVIPGVEVTTAEEIHIICLFPSLTCAEKAGLELETHLPPVKNRPEFFGEQLVMDEKENILEKYPFLFSNALGISIDALPALVKKYGGICYPAHIDRQANSILTVLGCLPVLPEFKALEILKPQEFFKEPANRALASKRLILTSSDAHQLTGISETEHFIDLEEPSFNALVRALK